MNKPRTEVAKYEAKILEIRARFDEANGKLASVLGQVSAAEERLVEVQKLVTAAGQEVERLRKEADTLSLRAKDAGTQEDVALHHSGDTIAAAVALTDTARKDVAKAEKKLATLAREEARVAARITKLSTRMALLEGKADHAEQRSKKADAKVREADKTIAQLLIVQKETKELIDRNSLLVTKNARQLGKLDMFVKRLQRYYDRHGIKINILQQFGIGRT